MHIVEFTAGRLLCGRIRDYLKTAQFHGYKFEWMESGGLLSHRFILKSEDNTVLKLKQDLEEQAAEIGILEYYE